MADPNGDAVRYYFRVATGPDAETNVVWNSGWRTGAGANTVTMPAGVLQDGRTYYWHVYTWDGIAAAGTPGPVWSFKVDRRLGADTTQALDAVGPVTANLGTGNLFFTTTGPQLPAVGGTAGLALSYNSTPPSPGSTVLPAGWQVSAAEGGAEWVAARRSPHSTVLVEVTGVTVEYKWNGTGFVPPEGEDGILTLNPDNTLTFADADGWEYRFDAAGVLLSATNALDDRQPAALRYTWGGSPARLTTITDPVSDRQLTLHYGGDTACPTTPPAELAVAPSGKLCLVAYWDGTQTVLWHHTPTNGSQLARIEDPCGEITDFGYANVAGTLRLARIRDPLAADAVAAGVHSDTPACDTTCTIVAYDTAGRVASVTLPEPTPGAPRSQHSYAYNPATRTTVVTAAGITGALRTVTYDTRGTRILTDNDATGARTETIWDVPDRTRATIDPAGRMTSTVYDLAGRPTDTYGPAPRTCFITPTDTLRGAYLPKTTGIPAECGTQPMPRTQTRYDEGIISLAATYWANATLSGIATVHDTGIGHPTGAISRDWAAIPPHELPGGGWGLRLTGEVTLPPGTGNQNYVFATIAKGGTRVWIDDRMVVNNWAEPAGTGWFRSTNDVTLTLAAGSTHRIRVDYFDTNTTTPGSNGAGLQLHWSHPGGYGSIPGANLHPRYGLATTTTSFDNSPATPSEVTRTAYTSTGGLGPHHGLATSVTQDPVGLALTSTTDYEAPGTGWLRRTARTLPAGPATRVTYTYYGDSETRTNPCDPQAPPANQAGMLQTTTAADPDGPAGPETPIVREAVYDNAGQTIAARIVGDTGGPGNDGWHCTTYDARGRVEVQIHPANGAEPERTVVNNYAVDLNPLVTSVTDAAGTITTTVELLGRVIAYTDVWGSTTTTSYDQAGRVTGSSGPLGTVSLGYDPAGRLETQTLDGGLIADPTYGAPGKELSGVTYPAGTGNAGNGTALTTIGRDPAGRNTRLTWTLAGGATVDDQVTHSQAGKIIDQTIDDADPNPAGHNYQYDGAGRLIRAHVPGHTLDYGFADTTTCTANQAGRNTNRTSLRDNDVPVAQYCYDHADRLTAVTPAGPYTTIAYDAHGSTIHLGAETHGYDSTDRHIVTTSGPTTVRYVRDAVDRIVARIVNGAAVAKYAYTGDGDTPELTLDPAGSVTERFIGLPGGVMVTTRGIGDVWSYPNIHGDTSATANGTGTRTGGTFHYDPYGNPLEVGGRLETPVALDIDERSRLLV